MSATKQSPGAMRRVSVVMRAMERSSRGIAPVSSSRNAPAMRATVQKEPPIVTS